MFTVREHSFTWWEYWWYMWPFSLFLIGVFLIQWKTSYFKKILSIWKVSYLKSWLFCQWTVLQQSWVRQAPTLVPLLEGGQRQVLVGSEVGQRAGRWYKAPMALWTDQVMERREVSRARSHLSLGHHILEQNSMSPGILSLILASQVTMKKHTSC